MTFRTRLTLLTTLTVAVTLVAASVAVYYFYRHDLLRQADGELAASLTVAPVSKMITLGTTVSANVRWKPSPPVRVVAPGSSTALLVRSIPVPAVSPGYTAAGGPYSYSTISVNGVPERQLTIFGLTSAVTITRSLADVQRSLTRLRWLLFVACLGGIAVATALGAVVSGRAILPLRRLTETTERIAATGEVTARTAQPGRDEISRLSKQLDALLATVEQSLRTQRQFVADASHELRTPLATLRANVGLLAHPNGLDAHERDELVADVEEELQAMTSLVGELVELAHGEELDSAPTEFRLDHVVQSSLDRASRRTGSVAFRAHLEPTTVVGVPERLERAVDNLLDNARKWSPKDGTVEVSLRDGVIEVRDHGPGVAAGDAPDVFDRFYRSIEARGTPGAGLGLAIVKQVADAHNGSVTIDQAADGGAIFRLSLHPSDRRG